MVVVPSREGFPTLRRPIRGCHSEYVSAPVVRYASYSPFPLQLADSESFVGDPGGSSEDLFVSDVIYLIQYFTSKL